MAREVAHEGNEQALREYSFQNKEALEAELRELKEGKQLALKRCRDSALPVSVQQWLHWLDDHDAEFRALLERATEDCKRYNKRSQPLASAVNNAAMRIRPSARNNVCGARTLLRRPSGWYCLCQGEVRLVGYVSAIGTNVNLVALRRAASGHQREFEFDLATPVSQQAIPVASWPADFRAVRVIFSHLQTCSAICSGGYARSIDVHARSSSSSKSQSRQALWRG